MGSTSKIDIDILESVQRRADHRIVLLYTIINDLVGVPATQYFTLNNQRKRILTSKTPNRNFIALKRNFNEHVKVRKERFQVQITNTTYY